MSKTDKLILKKDNKENSFSMGYYLVVLFVCSFVLSCGSGNRMNTNANCLQLSEIIRTLNSLLSHISYILPGEDCLREFQNRSQIHRLFLKNHFSSSVDLRESLRRLHI